MSQPENVSAAYVREYVTPYHTSTAHLVAFKSRSSAASLCGRSWPLQDAGLSFTKPRAPVCFNCRRSEAASAR